MEKNNNFLFVVNDIEIGITKYNSEDIYKTLLNKKEWIFGKQRVPHLLKMKKNDNVILYLSGFRRRHFIGKFKMKSDIKKFNYDEFKDEGFYKFFDKKVEIENIELWDKKLYIIDVKDDLEFITQKRNYGLNLRQGIRMLSDSDYNLIIDRYKKL